MPRPRVHQPKHLPSFRHRDARMPSFGLAGLQHAQRHRISLEEFGVAFQLLGCENILREGLQVFALKRHKAGALERDQQLAGGNPVASRNRQTGDHAGHRSADDPLLWIRYNNLGGIG